jgi:glycosyltransferase involved in cell wall biosynthesis
MSIKISIVLPCYNEEQAIPNVVSACVALKDKNRNEHASICEIIVVDDGSKDQSILELQKFGDQVKVIKHVTNLGYGAALKTGIKESKGDVIALFDLDSTCSPNDINKLVKAMLEQNAEMVVGQRMSTTSGMPAVRTLGNLIFSLLTKVFFNSKHHDVCSGYRLIKTDSIKPYLNLLNNDLSFCLGASLKFLIDGRKIVSVPISYAERTGQSKLSAFREGPQFLMQILSQWLYYRAK